MARVRLSGWFAIALLGTGCPYAIPGIRADVGAEAAAVSGKLEPALHLAAGVSLASIVKQPRPFDIGAGYVLFYPNPLDTVHGAYVDAAWLHRFRPDLQLSIGPRFELLLQERQKGLHGGVGAALRVGIEAITFTDKEFGATSGNGTGFGFILGQSYGSLAIGFSTEVGVRRLPGAIYAVYGTLSVTFRLPASAGLVLFIPFPK